MEKKITFEDLPQLTLDILSEVKELRELVNPIIQAHSQDHYVHNELEMIDINDVCRILNLKKPTVYHKVQQGKINSYKPSGCKKLMFLFSGIMDYIQNSSLNVDTDCILAGIQNSIRHKPTALSKKT